MGSSTGESDEARRTAAGSAGSHSSVEISDAIEGKAAPVLGFSSSRAICDWLAFGSFSMSLASFTTILENRTWHALTVLRVLAGG